MEELERLAVAAYAIDRALRHTAGSGARAALEEFAVTILNCDHIKALEHGELDDLMAWARHDMCTMIRPHIAPPKRDSSGGYEVQAPEVPCPCCEANEPCHVGPDGTRCCTCCMDTGKVPAVEAAMMREARAALKVRK